MTNVCKEAKNVWKGRENILKGGSTNQSDEKKYYKANTNQINANKWYQIFEIIKYENSSSI